MVLDLVKLLLTLPFLLVLPGLFLQLAIFGWRGGKISFFERAIFSVPLSLVSVNLIILLLAKIGVILKGPTIAGSILIFCALCFAVFQLRFKGKRETGEKRKDGDNPLFDFSFRQAVFILLALLLAVFMRTAYLADTILPSATDLGHHMYWVQTIIDSGRLPSYGMPDFIIGEHMIFAAANLVSGIGVMTAMPALVLLFANVAGIFTMAALVGRVFKNRNAVAISFFTVGVLYAINPPQGRYVSGGVIGNVVGDMLIPVALYFLYRALTEKNRIFAGLFLFSFAGLLYTHHLSSFIFIFSAAAILVLYLILNFKIIFKIISEWIKVFAKPFPIAIVLLFVLYFLYIFTPSYFNPAAVDQATGTPVKVTRIGLSLAQIDSSAGSALLVLGALGFLLAALAIRPKEMKYSVALGWLAVLFAMTWKPALLHINIPSDRIGNYLFLPLTFLAAYALVRYFEFFRAAASGFFAKALLFVVLFFVITNGLADSADAFKARPQFQEAMEVFHSGEYLASTVDIERDVILKDHVNIYADSWYKLFFMKNYKYPLSRGNLSRYVDPTNPRETCTRDMIMEPESERGRACFSDTGVNYVVLNTENEGNIFEKYPGFSKVYGSDYVSIFKKDK